MMPRPPFHWRALGEPGLVGGIDWMTSESIPSCSLSERLTPPLKLPGVAFLCRESSFTLKLAYLSLWAFDKVE